MSQIIGLHLEDGDNNSCKSKNSINFNNSNKHGNLLKMVKLFTNIPETISNLSLSNTLATILNSINLSKEWKSCSCFILME